MSSPKSSFSTPFDSEIDLFVGDASAPASSAASSPPPNVLSEYTSCASSELGDAAPGTDYESMKEEDVEESKAAPAATLDDAEKESRLSRLQFLIRQSTAYSTILKQRMDEEKEKQALLEAKRRQSEKTGAKRAPSDDIASPQRGGKRKKGSDGKAEVALAPEEDEDGVPTMFRQPRLITGAKLKPYQLEGLQWMVSLDQNGISGILADEMGLGKTLQTISFSAYLREHGNFKPFLVVCPLSVLHNWEAEYKKFAPDIPTCVYHGSKEDRAQLRRTVMRLPGGAVRPVPVKPTKKGTAKAKSNAKAPTKRKAGRPSKGKPSNDDSARRRSGRPHKPIIIESDSDDDTKDRARQARDDPAMVVDDNEKPPEDYTAAFPVVLTTYDIIMNDRVFLQHYQWGYIVVDEGHRLKNLDCKLMREIKQYSSAGRMILTGTPLHNNLSELWSLLNFILPDIFEDLDTFQEWFNLPDLQSSLPSDQSHQIVSSLHAILKPFLLRRLKVDVEMNLPPKKEYVLYAPLSVRQREAYDRVLDGGLREWLIKGGTAGSGEQPDAEGEVVVEDSDSEEDVPLEKRRVSRRLARGGRKNYNVDGDDDEYFGMVERGEVDERGMKIVKSKAELEVERERLGQEHQQRAKVRKVNNMKLQNAVMQLRKVCSHPFLFDWPVDPKTHDPVLGEELVNASGKMMVLDRLLRELFKRGHKVLIFSQFKIMLDIIQDWAEDCMGWKLCRIDGSTKPEDRREQMNWFQTGSDAPSLFLLSTRAGGLGINLTAADTVIFYDQDWNPQMDAQAQDRAHRIGQTRPVLIFRLVSAHTIETKIMQRAGEKRKLEALVIAKGKFKMPASAAASSSANINKRETMAEMAAALLRLEGEKIEVVPNTREGKQGVLSDEDLDTLLDRRPEVFRERGGGWGVSAAKAKGAEEKEEVPVMEDGQLNHAAIGAGKKAAFAVYQAPVEEGNEALAKMLAEDP